MGHADDMVASGQRHTEQLIGQDGSHIGEAKQRMIRENGVDSHEFCVEQCLMGQWGEGRVSVDNVDVVAEKDGPEKGKTDQHGGEDALVVERWDGEVVDFDAAGNVAHTDSRSVPERKLKFNEYRNLMD